MSASYGVVDLFAGPGGLSEGFDPLAGTDHSPFRIGISVEKEFSAPKTLRLRSCLRAFRSEHGRLPEQYIQFHAGEQVEPSWEDIDATCWRAASHEARLLELGTPEVALMVDTAIRNIQKTHDDSILIGGPPCQAYSLVGRARSQGMKGYRPERDHRHFLFREYIRVLDRLRPAAFVMENVKGMLSSTVQTRRVFEMLMEDLTSLGSRRGHLYELRAVHLGDAGLRLVKVEKPADFIVRAEQFEVPQRRHRLIIVGLRSDIASRADDVVLPPCGSSDRHVKAAIGSLPALRSGLSKGVDTTDRWASVVSQAAAELARVHNVKCDDAMAAAFRKVGAAMKQGRTASQRSSRSLPEGYATSEDGLSRWLENPELRAIAQHESRGHMESDLGRYLFAAVHGRVHGSSPKSGDFPPMLAPDHRNWNSGIFADRFRVQLADEPATTVTSHISKDGHYFIHPDPLQCRSLTVREAARLQTFPDDYLFLGNRTQQYVQVGNAVPPYLARQIAQLLLRVLEGDEASSGASASNSDELVAA